MLNFASNNEVAVKTTEGVVILSVDEYRRMLTALIEAEAIINSLVSVRQSPYDSSTIEVNVDKEVVYGMALRALKKDYTEEELRNYNVARPSDFWVAAAYMATKTPKTPSNNDDDTDEMDTVSASAQHDDINRPIVDDEA